jgi:hypothetical protein
MNPVGADAAFGFMLDLCLAEPGSGSIGQALLETLNVPFDYRLPVDDTRAIT